MSSFCALKYYIVKKGIDFPVPSRDVTTGWKVLGVCSFETSSPNPSRKWANKFIVQDRSLVSNLDLPDSTPAHQPLNYAALGTIRCSSVDGTLIQERKEINLFTPKSSLWWSFKFFTFFLHLLLKVKSDIETGWPWKCSSGLLLRCMKTQTKSTHTRKAKPNKPHTPAFYNLNQSLRYNHKLKNK